jgi:tetratricopeptide (TPR) repeat protein
VCERDAFAEGESHFREALRIYRSQPGNQHFFDVAFALNNLADALIMQDKHQEAEDALHEALDIYRKYWPANNPHLINTLNYFGIEMQRQGRFAEAEVHFREALARARQCFPAEPRAWQPEVGSLGEVLQSQHKEAEYQKLLAELPPEAKPERSK